MWGVQGPQYYATLYLMMEINYPCVYCISLQPVYRIIISELAILQKGAGKNLFLLERSLYHQSIFWYFEILSLLLKKRITLINASASKEA